MGDGPRAHATGGGRIEGGREGSVFAFQRKKEKVNLKEATGEKSNRDLGKRTIFHCETRQAVQTVRPTYAGQSSKKKRRRRGEEIVFVATLKQFEHSCKDGVDVRGKKTGGFVAIAV